MHGFVLTRPGHLVTQGDVERRLVQGRRFVLPSYSKSVLGPHLNDALLVRGEVEVGGKICQPDSGLGSECSGRLGHVEWLRPFGLKL